MEWKYYNPIFECDIYNHDMLKYAPWSGHRGFIYDLIVNLVPGTIVELGSFYGCSSFAIGQAIKDNGLESELWSIDVWEAMDDYTKHSYEADIYHEFLNVRDKCYSERYIKTLKTTFDEARKQFGNKQIDLLHIDGSHHYDDVKHDFQYWKDSLKDDAIILFHDIGEDKVNGDIMGSHTFWKEIKKDFMYTFEFGFSCGLGVLCMSKNSYDKFSNMSLTYYQKKVNLDDAIIKDELCKYSFQINDLKNYIGDLKKQIEIKEEHLENYKKQIENVQRDYEKTIAVKDEYLKELENKVEIKDEQISKYIEQIDLVKRDYQKTIVDKDAYIRKLEENCGKNQV